MTLERREAIPILQPAEYLLERPEYAVLANLESTHGINPIPHLARKIVNDGGIVLIEGDAGGGKTTAASQFRRLVEQVGVLEGKTVKTDAYYFDQAYSKKERETGLDRYRWSQEQWMELNEEMAEEIFRRHPTDRDGSTSLLLEVEVPGVGRAFEEKLTPAYLPYSGDRGVGMTKKAIEMAEERGLNLFLLHFAPDPALQLKAGYVRVEVTALRNPQDVFSYLEAHQIFFSDFNPSDYTPFELKQYGRLLQNVYKKMALQTHMERVREYERAIEHEYKNQRLQDYAERSRRIRPRYRTDSTIEVAYEFGMTGIATDSILNDFEGKVLNMLAYAEYKLHTLGMDEGTHHVVQNPRRTDIRVYSTLADFIKFKPKEKK